MNFIKVEISENLRSGLHDFQENDSEKISEMINQIIQENQDIVDRIKLGEDKLVGFLVGQLMKQSNGSINPGMAKDLLLKELGD